MKNILFFALILFLSYNTYAQELEADDFVLIEQTDAAYPGFNAKTYRGLFPVGHGQFKMFNYGGTPGNLTALGANETLGSFVFNGYDGSSNVISAVIQAKTIADSRDPRFNFLLSNGTGNQRPNRMTIIGQTGNVGIGITDPTERLDVNGNIRMRSGAVEGYILVSDSDGKMTWTDPSTVKTASLWEQFGNDVFTNAFVGIGTDTPNASLDISSSFSDAIRLNGLAAKAQVTFYDAGVYKGVAGLYNDDMSFGTGYNNPGKTHMITNGSPRITALQNGNVGIGTTTPTTVMDVNGNIRMRTGATAGYLPVSDADGNMTWTDPSTITTASLWTEIGASSIYKTNGFIGIGGVPTAKFHITQSSYFLNSGIQITTPSGLNWYMSMSENDDFVFADDTIFDMLTLQYGTGNIGIGATPTEKMDVNGNIRMRTGAAAGYLPVSDVNGKMTWTNPNTIFTPSPWTTSGTNVYLSDGNVGIGGASANTRLHIRQSGTGLSGGIRMTSSENTAEDWYMHMNENDDLTFSDDGNTVLTLQDGTGNVGIGVENASGNTRLYVKTDVGAALHGIAAEIIYEGDANLYGLYGESVPADGYGYGGYGKGGSIGIYGVADGGAYTGSTFGVYGYANGSAGTRYGIYGQTFGGTTNYAGYFAGNVTVTGTFTNPSDRKLKQNVESYTDALEVINQLEAKTYDYKKGEFEGMGLPSQHQIGFIAQEVEEVLPNLVTDNVHPEETEHDEAGKRTIIKEAINYKGINYIGLIPILTQGIKELSTTVEEKEEVIEALAKNNVTMKTEIEALAKDNATMKAEMSEMAAMMESMNDKFNQMEEDLSSCCLSGTDNRTGSANTNVELNGSDIPSLEQNNPNPFYEQTIIKYYIPSLAKSARMIISDIKGSPIKSVNLTDRGLGTVTINANELPVGTYIYTLFVDGKQVESKQMILVK